MPNGQAALNSARSAAGRLGGAVTITGLTETSSALQALPEKLKRKLGMDLKTDLAFLVTDASSRAPRDDSDLAMSIRIKSATRGRRIGAKIGSTKPYAGVIEFGHRSSVREYRRKGVKVSGYTRQLQNKPYLMPTLDANRTAIIAKVQAIINRGLQTVWEGGFGG